MVFAQDPLLSRDRELVSRDSIEAMRATPGVRGVAEYFAVKTVVRSEEVVLGSLAVEPLVAHSGGARTLADDPDATIAALRRGELAMKRAFATHFGVAVGDKLEITTDRGPRRFRIGAVARSNLGSIAVLFLDVSVFVRWFRPPGAAQVAIWTDEPQQAVFDLIQGHTEQALFFRHGDLFRKHTALVLAKFNDLLRLPAALIGSIGFVALVNLLFGNVVARQRDLSLIRSSGGTSANLVAMVLVNAVLIGSLGTGCGVGLGMLWTVMVAGAVAEPLSIEVRVHPDLPAMAGVVLAALALSVAAGLAPALVGRRRVTSGVAALG
jgi:ABC-type lipoprotein release transport system permease subunit